MVEHNEDKLRSSIFITFSGNCREALSFYQNCFGGVLHFNSFKRGLQGYKDNPVISGSLVSDRIIIHGSDLVHSEGRKIGNYISILLHCQNIDNRRELIKTLRGEGNNFYNDQKLIEITDAFEVRWILSI